jgi:hypothetical protein
MPSNGPSRSLLLDKLNQEASVATSSANDFSIRAWITSAKKCLDQVLARLSSIMCRPKRMSGKKTLKLRMSIMSKQSVS